MRSRFENETLQLREWHTPASDYPEAQVGDWRIKRCKYSPSYYEMYGLDGYLYYEVKKSIPVTLLEERRDGRWHTWMVDDPPHWRAMQKYAEACSGSVLCAGLGLGLVHHALAQNRNVSSIFTVERSRDVEMLVIPQLLYMNEDVKSQCHYCLAGHDFWDFTEKVASDHSQSWDWIIIDLWVVRGLKQKRELLYREVLPRVLRLKAHHPSAKIIVHGFTGLTDMKLVDDAIMLEVAQLAEIVRISTENRGKRNS